MKLGYVHTALLALALSLSGAQSLRADTFTVADRSLSVDLPAGYCALDRSDPVENQMFEVMERIQAGTNRVLLVFYDCEELASLRRGESDTFDRYGQVLTPSGEQAYPGISRQIYFGELRKVFDQAFAIGAQRGQENVARVLPDMAIGEARSLGIVYEDDAALYAGMAEKISFGGGEFTVAVIIAMTMIKDVPISVNLYQPYAGDDDSFGQLLMEQLPYLRSIVGQNEQLEGRLAPQPATPGDDS